MQSHNDRSCGGDRIALCGTFKFVANPRRGDPMMTEQVLNNLIGRGTAHSSIPLIAQEMMRPSQALERQAHNLTSAHVSRRRCRVWASAGLNQRDQGLGRVASYRSAAVDFQDHAGQELGFGRTKK